MPQIEGRIFDPSTYGWIADVVGTHASSGDVTKIYVDGSLAERDVSIAWLAAEIHVLDVSAGTSYAYVDGSLASRDVSIAWLDTNKANIGDIPTDFYSQAYVDGSLNAKADTGDIPTDFYSQSYIDGSLAQRDVDIAQNTSDIADVSSNIPTDFYSQAYVDGSLNDKADNSDIPTDFYSQAYVDGSLNNKADTGDIPTDFYSQAYVDGSLAQRDINITQNTSDIADVSSNIPTDFYSKAYVDGSLNNKADNSDIPTDFYSQTYVDGSLNAKADTGDIPTDFYSKAYVDGSLNSKQDTIADGTYVKEASLGDGLYWVAGSLDVSVEGGSGDVTQAYVDGSLALRDTSISWLDDNKIPLNIGYESSIATDDAVRYYLTPPDPSGSGYTSVFEFTAISSVEYYPWMKLGGRNPIFVISEYGNDGITINRWIKSDSDTYVDASFYKKDYIDGSLNAKANTSDIPTDFYSQAYVDGSLNLKANISDTYSQIYIDGSLNDKADTSDIPTDFYSQSYVDGSLNAKQDTIADGTYVKEASLGDTLYWDTGALEASTGTTINEINDIGDVSLGDVSIGDVFAYEDGSVWGSLKTEEVITNDTPDSSAYGESGQFAYDASYFYICTDASNWGRILIDFDY